MARNITWTTRPWPRRRCRRSRACSPPSRRRRWPRPSSRRPRPTCATSSAIDIAENEKKTAKLQLDTAKLTQKSAEQSGDLNRKNQAAHDIRVAELGVKAAEAKVDWLEKKRKWVKAQKEAAENHWAAADSRCELEKAKLAQQKGIKPSDDFNVVNFETDNMKKQQDYSEARMDADKMQADVDRLERDYQAQLAAYTQAKGSH